MEYENIIATHDLAWKFSIDCASVICPTVDIIFSKTQLKLGEKAIARMRETMGESDPAADYKIYTAEEAREKFMTPDALGAFEYTAGSLSAYAFTTGILKLALAQGLNVQTTTPAESLAWSSGSEGGYEYMMTLPAAAVNAGDIVVGGGLHQLPNDGATRYGETDDSDLEPSIQEYLRDCTPRFFGKNWGRDHQAGRIKKEWSGIMGASADGLPYVGAVPNVAPGLWMSCSFNGHGMVWCLKSAEALVGTMVGDEAEQKVIRKDLRAPGETEFGERARL
ncbi:hypothetical protein KC367_g2611 [Hortaea werneckii]|nr:hypothetical protein KC367_g2611 [Hortaea werneckii]